MLNIYATKQACGPRLRSQAKKKSAWACGPRLRQKKKNELNSKSS